MTTETKTRAVIEGGTSSKPNIISRSDMPRVDPKLIRRIEGWNPRFDMGDIESLAKSIKYQKSLDGVGVLRALEVIRNDDGGFDLNDGDRRLTAVELLMKRGEVFDKGIPVVLLDKKLSKLDRLVRISEANGGKELLPLEEATLYHAMRKEGATIKEMQVRLGRSDVHIVERMALLEADEEVQEALKSKKITTTVAQGIAVHARGNSAKQKALVKQALDAGKDKAKRRAVNNEIQEARKEKNAARGRAIVMKVRPLTADQLSKMGALVAEKLAEQMAEAGFPAEMDLEAWVLKKSTTLLAYTFGVLQGSKACAGLQVKTDLAGQKSF